MITPGNRPHRSFIDQSGWEVDDAPASGFATHANFMKNVENHMREQAIHQRRRSRYEELYKERLKLRQTVRDPNETCEFPEIYVQNPQFLTVNTLDLGNTNRRSKWPRNSKEPFRIHAGGTVSLQMSPQRRWGKESPKPRMKGDQIMIDQSTRRMYVEYRKPGELIDDLASKHLTHYLRERKEEHLKTARGIFQLPFGNKP